MSKSFYCPVCGVFQEKVDLEETDMNFICDKCNTQIHFDKWNEDNAQIEFTVIVNNE